ncbi:N-acetylmuramoyl-L-alanine amidase [Edaphobacter sp. HDX4]|uniref:N-acetylmuramoyl-L-alanine amidase family protein n=1 Tax=Edaphobacter sp. HDX4 TaxID=2794064 RepID=UPI002FE5FBA7
MTRTCDLISTLTILLLTAGGALSAQTPAAPQPSAGSNAVEHTAPAPPKPPPAFYRNLIVLDPAHGGPDSGAQLSSSAAEKDVTLSFAQKLRPALAAQGFTVMSTRDSDPSDELTTDVRAGIANHVRPLACVILHATAAGSGIHIVTSTLTEPDSKSVSHAPRWNEAQETAIGMSIKLANEIGLSLQENHIPVLLLRSSVPPIDNLICPAVAVEVAPMQSTGKATPASDSAYQQRIATSVSAGIASFRTHNAPAPASVPAARAGASQ